ncbi:MAG: phage tail domain-containing protein [Bacillota bacterium]
MFTNLGFTFDGVHSDDMGVFIGDFNSGTQTQPTGTSQKIQEIQMPRKDVPLFQYVENEPISFSLTIMANEVISPTKMQQLLGWLIKDRYKKFQSDDYENIVYYVIVTGGINKVMLGNEPIGLELNFRTDAAHAWFELPEYQFTATGFNEITINNPTNKMGVFYPTIEFELQGTENQIKITNLTDDPARTTEITELSQYEVLQIRNGTRQLISSTPNYRLGNFNRNWFRIVPGDNQILLETNSIFKLERKFPIYI